MEAAAALHTPTDLLVPAAVGGLSTEAAVGSLGCAAVVGPANDQLADDQVAESLHRAGIVWVPDHVVGAGGIIGAVGREREGMDETAVTQEVNGIAASTSEVLARAERQGQTPHRTALAVVRERVREAGRTPRSSVARAAAAQGRP